MHTNLRGGINYTISGRQLIHTTRSLRKTTAEYIDIYWLEVVQILHQCVWV